MSIEIIAGKTFVEESYPISDIGGGVISKGQAIRHFEKKHSEYAVVAVSSFKIDHQTETIKIRVQVKLKVAKLEKHVFLPDENAKPVDPVALLQPGYGELKEKYDALRIAHDKLLKEYKIVEERMVRHDRTVAEEAMEVDLSSGPFSESAPTAESILAHATGADEDAADLANAKEVLDKSQFVPLTGIDPGPEDGDDTTTK